MRTESREPQEAESVRRLRERVAKLRRLAEDPRTPIEERRRAYEKWADMAQRLPPLPKKPEPARKTSKERTDFGSTSDFYDALSPRLQSILLAATAFDLLISLLGRRRRRGRFGW